MAPFATPESKQPKAVTTAAATSAGFLEMGLFHPFDTVAKRLMSNTAPICGACRADTMRNLNVIMFKKHADGTVAKKLGSLYPGFVYGVLYKVLQRVYKFAGQPIVREMLNACGAGQRMRESFGQKGGKLMTESVAGMMIGIGEVVLLPLDRLKVLSQTNDAALKNRSLIKIFMTEGRGMYAGTGVTILRNAPGSFCLFGGTAFTKDVIFGLNDYSKASLLQNMAAAAVGSCLSITVTNPMDVVKTRVQNKNFGEAVTSGQVVRGIMREEGIGAFFKGLILKATASAPKLVFAYTMTEYFIHLYALILGSSQSRSVVQTSVVAN
jgi:hypothetical protein